MCQDRVRRHGGRVACFCALLLSVLLPNDAPADFVEVHDPGLNLVGYRSIQVVEPGGIPSKGASINIYGEEFSYSAAHYINEMATASKACDRVRYDRAVLGLRGLLGQIDQDKASIPTREAKLEANSELTFGRKAFMLAQLDTELLHLNENYLAIKDILDKWVPFNAFCKTPTESVALCPECKALDDEIAASQRRLTQLEADLSKPQAAGAKEVIEAQIKVIK